MKKSDISSWESVHKWYDSTTGDAGHYYHRQLILPLLNKAWKFPTGSKVLDLGCGQGVFARTLPPPCEYVGLDNSPSLIQLAKKQSRSEKDQFKVQDVTIPFDLKSTFTHALFLLSLQNIHNPLAALKNASHHLVTGGELGIVLNHPSFRIPRQSSWEIDQNKKLQYRRIESYMSSLEVPIQMHPGKAESPHTYSYHWPLSVLSKWLVSAGFMIKSIEELCGDKKSTGARAKMEDRARQEFPLFMVLFCRKHIPK